MLQAVLKLRGGNLQKVIPESVFCQYFQLPLIGVVWRVQRTNKYPSGSLNVVYQNPERDSDASVLTLKLM